MGSPKITIVAACLFVFLFSLYSITISTSIAVRNQGEGFMKINEMENFLRTGDIGFPNSDKWGAVGRGGKRYNWHQFGQQAFVIPLYLFMRMQGYAYYLVNMASTALTAVLLMRILVLIGFGLRPSAITSLLYGTVTLAWYYASKTPHEHALAIVFIMGGIYYAMRYQMGFGRRNLLICMVSIGLGFTVRYDAILSTIPIALYLFTGREENADEKFSLPKATVVSSLILAPFFMANAFYNYMRFETFFSSGYSGLAGTAKLFAIEYIPRGIIGALFSPGRSIFLFSPLLFLFPLYVIKFKRRTDRRAFILFLTTTVIYFLFYCYYVFGGDWCFGPRYYLPIMPFLVMPLVILFDGFKKRKTWVKTLTIGVIAFSLLVQIVFVTSNTYFSNVIRFGISDDSLPELTKKYTRDFGEQGSWEAIWSYFPIKYSQFFNQFKLFRYTVMINIDESNINQVADEILSSESPYLVVYINALREFDVWWLQRTSRISSGVLIIPAALGISAFIIMFWTLRKTAPQKTE
jgi:hypothetical protein